MLKWLELVGFKSFAEKTRLEFPAGVTAIVGPNGSGKSNVVDAVKWVLGSQSPRSLRGKEMTDVIFNGSESRGQMPSAEVTLAFENAATPEGGRRLFDLDLDEVRLTRRVGRSGEGEYLVNGRTCRLKDFRDLLAGTGAGPDAYSLIEQGRVDAALRASPVERRLLLEEAAGVSRFRLKKREAARRLDRVEQNLLRLSDIVDEVEGRLRRVRAQAGKARRYREATLRLREARIELATDDWRRLDAERRRLDAERDSLAERIESLEAEVTQNEQRLSETRESFRADDRLDQSRRAAEQLLTKLERQRAVASAEWLRHRDAVAAADRDLVAARRELAEAAPDQATLDALRVAEDENEQIAAQLKEGQQQVAAAQARLARARSTHEALRERSERLTEVRRRWRQRLEQLRRRHEEDAAAVASLDGDRAKQRDLLESSVNAMHEATSRRNAATDRLLQLDESSHVTQRELANARQELKRHGETAAALREKLVALRHRLDAILREEQRLERLNAEVRRVVAAAPSDAPLQVFGLVADLIHVEADFAPLIEAALGEQAEHVVIDSRSALLRALAEIENASASLSTRAGFVGLDTSVPPTAIEQVDLAGTPGVIGRASEFIEVEPRFVDLARRLVGRTWFVDDLNTAKRLAASVGRGLSFVTLGGEVITAAGAVVCGVDKEARHVLTRRGDAERLRAQIAATERDRDAEEGATAAVEERIRRLEADLAAGRQDAKSERETLAAAAHEAAAFEERRRHADAALAKASQDVGRRQRSSERALPRIEILAGRLGRDSEAVYESRAEEIANEIREAEVAASAHRSRVEELNARASELRESMAALQAQASARQPVGSDLALRVESLAEEVTRIRREAEVAACVVLSVGSASAEAALAAEAAEREAREARLARAAAERVIAELAAVTSQSRAEVDTLTKRRGEAELTRSRVEIEAKAAVQRVRDDYGVDVTEHARASTAETLDRTALREEIDQLRRVVQSIGAVNSDALEELDELESRFAQLSGQYADLSEAKKSLARLTTRIDKDSRELFRATFETVRQHFRELFTRLFGGGEADLILVDPDGAEAKSDLLEAGVEIVACPPGKELRSLTLMSGGEKTMTCVALLLALFRSRPSPFCVLDEVDAALDEANIGRFMDVLTDFLSSTQFLVVTHSRRTMAAASTLYGVTMQESGVSTPLSVRFEDVGEGGQVRVANGSQNPSRRAA